MRPSPFLCNMSGPRHYTTGGSRLIASDGARKHLYMFQTKRPPETCYFVVNLSLTQEGEIDPERGSINGLEYLDAKAMYDALPEKLIEAERAFGPLG